VAETAWFTYDDFADRVGEEFRVRVPEEHSLTLVLSEVEAGTRAGGTSPEGAPRQQFSLFFSGPSAPQLSQGIWELDHDGMGELALFLVPLAPDGEGARYEAAFA
jgi:hypothetical protein